MAYTPITLKSWLEANPNYDKYAGIVSGTPLIYQTTATAPEVDADSWFVWDWATELPDLTQAPETVDVTPTGRIARVLLNGVPAAAAAAALPVLLGDDTDKAIEALQGLEAVYKDALEGGERLYMGIFMGIGKKSPVFEAAASWGGSITGGFGEPYASTIDITPNLGAYNQLLTITNAAG